MKHLRQVIFLVAVALFSLLYFAYGPGSPRYWAKGGAAEVNWAEELRDSAVSTVGESVGRGRAR